MAGIIALSLIAAQLGAVAPAASATPLSSRASASAQASVRILSAAKVRLGSDTQPEGYKVTAGQIRLEDGSRHPAKLVEFQ